MSLITVIIIGTSTFIIGWLIGKYGLIAVKEWIVNKWNIVRGN